MQVTWIDEGEYLFDFKTDDAIYRFWDATPCVEFGFAMAEQAECGFEARNRVRGRDLTPSRAG